MIDKNRTTYKAEVRVHGLWHNVMTGTYEECNHVLDVLDFVDSPVRTRKGNVHLDIFYADEIGDRKEVIAEILEHRLLQFMAIDKNYAIIASSRYSPEKFTEKERGEIARLICQEHEIDHTSESILLSLYSFQRPRQPEMTQKEFEEILIRLNALKGL